MSVKSVIQSVVTGHLTSARREASLRAKAEAARQKTGAAHVVRYFHQVDDPYSHLAVQALEQVAARYEIELVPHLVGPPADWAAPERAKLVAYARLDAARLASAAGLSFTDPGGQPEPVALEEAQRRLAGALGSPGWVSLAREIGDHLWSGRPIGEGPAAEAGAAIAAGEAARASLGHFMSGMIQYGGEWYWGFDRLHYLEARLEALGARRFGGAPGPVYAPPLVPSGGGRKAGAELHWYLSFRSPYTYIAAERVKALADAYGAELKLRFVLPMVMRGLPVPRAKQMYFTLDTAREARRAGVPFGRIADPVGRPVERGYSLLPWARTEGRGFEFVLAFMRAVWANGVDAGSDAGLCRIVEAAGLDWGAARGLIGNDDWRAEAEANRAEMMAMGLWGVPCVRVGDVAAWGQDRLWVAEAALKALPEGNQ
ncbi:DsbA family protein [Hyphomonas sp.]|uniref:DsbA family protein n=1 Tax=Hyphomonas sp. TaxID=87 RepID=UPI0039189687